VAFQIESLAFLRQNLQRNLVKAWWWCWCYPTPFEGWRRRRTSRRTNSRSHSKDGGAEELHGDPTVMPHPKVWTRYQKWKK